VPHSNAETISVESSNYRRFWAPSRHNPSLRLLHAVPTLQGMPAALSSVKSARSVSRLQIEMSAGVVVPSTGSRRRAESAGATRERQMETGKVAGLGIRPAMSWSVHLVIHVLAVAIMCLSTSW
jgi:hypothetical protein